MDIVTKAAQGPRSTDRLIEALSTLAALLDSTIDEVKTLDSELQNRILQAVRDTEGSLQSQAAENLERALADLEQKIRKETTDKLKSQFEVDMSAALLAVRTEMEEEFKKKAAEMSAEWEEERRNLHGEIERASQAASQAVSTSQALAAEMALAAEKALAEKAKAPPPQPHSVGMDPDLMIKEMERVEALISGISALIDDPDIELSTVIRKNVERAELESYLRGLRYALGKSEIR